MIQINHVHKTFVGKNNKVEALRDVSIKVEKGDIFGVIGFSGAGKSTLIRLVNLLERPDQGQVIVKGDEITSLSGRELRSLRSDIGMIFQQFNLLQSKTVFQNIAAPLVIGGVKKEEIKRRVQELLEFVELSDKAEVYVSKLSGGQKQRVGIARALATNPSILLCDEATSALDPKTTQSILHLLKKINQDLGVTILLITHEMNVIKSICNKVAVMEMGQIIEQGEVIQVFSNPREKITADFVRTVIDDDIPESIKNALKLDGDKGEILKLKFFGENARDSLLSDLNRQFQVNFTILFASVNELQGQVLGILILKLSGSGQERERAKDYIRKSGVGLERVEI